MDNSASENDTRSKVEALLYPKNVVIVGASDKRPLVGADYEDRRMLARVRRRYDGLPCKARDLSGRRDRGLPAFLYQVECQVTASLDGDREVLALGYRPPAPVAYSRGPNGVASGCSAYAIAQ